MDKVKITLFRWAGSWGPFKVSIPCGECAMTEAIIDDVVNQELGDIPVSIEVKDWLSFWWQPLLKSGWHAPIVMVEGRVISQGEGLNRGVLTQAVGELYAGQVPISGNHIFGKNDCPSCVGARKYFEQQGIDYKYHNIIHSPRALYEMIKRVKSIIGYNVPITVPQIWVDGKYVGGYDQLNLLSSIS